MNNAYLNGYYQGYMHKEADGAYKDVTGPMGYTKPKKSKPKTPAKVPEPQIDQAAAEAAVTSVNWADKWKEVQKEHDKHLEYLRNRFKKKKK